MLAGSDERTVDEEMETIGSLRAERQESRDRIDKLQSSFSELA